MLLTANGRSGCGPCSLALTCGGRAPQGQLFLDEGAVRAVNSRRKSLFAVGVKKVAGACCPCLSPCMQSMLLLLLTRGCAAPCRPA